MVADFGDLSVTPSLWLRGRYEPTATLALRVLTGSGSLVVDVGAHIGYYTLLAAQLAGPQGGVLAFEPNPLARRFLELNIQLNDLENVTVSDRALSDHNGTGLLYCQRQCSGAASLETSVVMNPEIVHDVTLETLDRIWRQEGHGRRMSLLKVDVQGHEARVLGGAYAVLREYRPAILLEFNPRQLALSGDDPALSLDMLAELDYSLLLVDEELSALRAGTLPWILSVCLAERSDGSGFRNVVAAQRSHIESLTRAGLLHPSVLHGLM
jgi:FkbM family methyltransferase